MFKLSAMAATFGRSPFPFCHPGHRAGVPLPLSVPCDDRVPIPLDNLSPPRAAKKKKRDPGSAAGATVSG